MFAKQLLVLAVVALAPSVGTAQSAVTQSAPVTTSSEDALSFGDVLRIWVWRQPDLTGDFVIGPDGSITHPLFHELKVAGVPLAEVQTALRSYLARSDVNPTFVVTPLFRIIVAGEVRQPNILTLPPRTTIASAIALAGGPTDRSKLDDVHVLRKGSTLRLDLTQPGSRSIQEEIRSGDQIVVPRRRSFVQDYLVPTSAVVAAVGTIATIIIQSRR